MKLKVKVGPVMLGDAMLALPAAEPVLDAENAGGRFVFVPKTMWPACAGEGVEGWVAKIMKVDKRSVAELKFHDGKECFKLESLITETKALS